MLSLQNVKVATLFNASYTNGATASATVDTLGFDEVLLIVSQSTADATGSNFSVMNIGEGDTSSSQTDLTGGTGDTDFTIPNASASAYQNYTFHLTRGSDWNKRYLKVTASPVTTQTITCVAVMGRPAEAPDTTTEKGTVLSVNL